MIKSKIRFKKHSGFTLVELMVSLTILVVVLVMLSGLSNFVSGKLRSAQNKELNDSIRQAFDAISQKMNNANDSITNTPSGKTVYGFRYYEQDKFATDLNSSSLPTAHPVILMIVSSGNTSQRKYCTFFGLDSGALKTTQMNEDDCKSSNLDNILWQSSLTPANVLVNSFTADLSNNNSSMMKASDSAPDQIPSVLVDVAAQAVTDATNNTELQTTFAMDLENVRNLMKNPTAE